MPDMQYRPVGRSIIKVSALGLGCRQFGRKDVAAETCESVVRRALDLGINFFDTADVYGDGRSEDHLGRALADIPRDSYILATKGGTERLGPGAERQNADPEFLARSLDGSLRRLNADYVDVYQLHNPDPAVPLEYTAEAFCRFMEKGKVRYAGVSNMSASELRQWLDLVPETVSIQLSYSLLDRSRVEDVFTDGHDLSVSLIPWAPLFAGFLTNPPPLDPEKRAEFFSMLPTNFMEKALRVSSLVEDLASDYGTTTSAIALSFVLRLREVATVPVGTTRPAHLEENLRCLEVDLAPADFERLDAASREVPAPEILATLAVRDVLDGGRIAVLPMGMKVRVPGGVHPGDRIAVNMWDGRVVSAQQGELPEGRSR